MKQNSLTDFINEVIVELQQEGRFATANIYKYALRAFTQSVGGGEIFWGGLNRGALHRFQTYLEDLQKSYNTISTYIRALRAVYNRAVDRGLVAGIPSVCKPEDRSGFGKKAGSYSFTDAEAGAYAPKPTATAEGSSSARRSFIDGTVARDALY